MRLATRYPELIKSLVLIGTSADPEPAKNIGRYKRLNFFARWFGFSLIANRILPIMFGQKFLQDSERRDLRQIWRQKFINNRRVGINRAVNGVINRQGISDQLNKIVAPTLIMVGDQDVATVLHKSERMHIKILHSQLLMISGAGHTATIEEPSAVNSALLNFYNGLL